MLGLTSRLIIEFRTGFFPAGFRAGVLTGDDILSANYNAALNIASSFEFSCPAAVLPAPAFDGGYMIVYESITDGLQVQEITVGHFALASAEFVSGSGGEWVARVRGESAVCWEMSSVGTPYPDYGGGWMFQALTFSQIHTHIERGIDVQVPVYAADYLSRQAISFDGGGSMMDHVSTTALQLGLTWRPIDNLLTPIIELFDSPPALTVYGYNQTLATIEPREPGGVSGVFGSFADAPIYEWSDCKLMFDFSRRYDSLYVWGGRWNVDGNPNDLLIYPGSDSFSPPYVNSVETYGRLYRSVQRISGGAPRPRRSMSLYYGNIRPQNLPPSVPQENEARQNLVDTGYKALTLLMAISRRNYQVIVPGSMLAHTRPGFPVSGQFRFPSVSTEQPYETLRCLTMSVTWQGDGTSTTTLELSDGFESLADYRTSDYGRDRYVVKTLQPAPAVSNSTTVVRVNYSVPTPFTYNFPVPYSSPPLVTVYDAPNGQHPIIISVTAAQVVFIWGGYISPFPGTTYVDLAITPPI